MAMPSYLTDDFFAVSFHHHDLKQFTIRILDKSFLSWTVQYPIVDNEILRVGTTHSLFILYAADADLFLQCINRDDDLIIDIPFGESISLRTIGVPQPYLASYLDPAFSMSLLTVNQLDLFKNIFGFSQGGFIRSFIKTPAAHSIHSWISLHPDYKTKTRFSTFFPSWGYITPKSPSLSPELS